MDYYWPDGDVVKGCCEKMRHTVADGGITIIHSPRPGLIGSDVVAFAMAEPWDGRDRIDYCPWCGSHDWNQEPKGMVPFPDLQRASLASAALRQLEDDEYGLLRLSLNRHPASS